MAIKCNVSSTDIERARQSVGSAMDIALRNARYTSSSGMQEKLNEAFELLRKADYALIGAGNIISSK